MWLNHFLYSVLLNAKKKICDDLYALKLYKSLHTINTIKDKIWWNKCNYFYYELILNQVTTKNLKQSLLWHDVSYVTEQ